MKRTNRARDKIVLENLHLADKAARRASRFKIPYDEAYSIALMSLIKAAEKWERKSVFSTFYYRVSYNDILQELLMQRKSLPMDLGDGDFDVSIDTRLDERIDARKALVRMRKKALELRKMRKKTVRDVKDLIPTFLDHVMQEYNVTEAAKRTGICKSTGDRLIWILRRAA